MRLTWVQPEDLLAHELVQAAAEGTDVRAQARRWQKAGGSLEPAVSGASAVPADDATRAVARALMDELDALEAPAHPDEPDGWDEILAVLPGAPALAAPGDDLAARIEAAWTGRAVGCLLGKPVEKIPRAGIEEITRATGTWPVTGYFTARGLPDDVAARWPWNRRSAPTSLAENIDGMPEDDDLNYPLLALTLLEHHGAALTTDDVAKAWLDNLPAGRVFTAERVAYRNLLAGHDAPRTATHQNPFREWIGALIRTDVYGWTRPGDLRGAARLAWVDARLSHTRNGVYGAMWAAALGSAALVAGSVSEALDAASAVVPPRSRLAEAIALGRRAGREAPDDAGALDALHEAYGHLHWVHVLNNAAVVACALERGRGDLTASIGLAVMAGWDTDSAGATVGGVVGAVGGPAVIEDRWSAPLRGVVATSLPGSSEHRLTDLAARTVALVDRSAS